MGHLKRGVFIIIENMDLLVFLVPNITFRVRLCRFIIEYNITDGL